MVDLVLSEMGEAHLVVGTVVLSRLVVPTVIPRGTGAQCRARRRRTAQVRTQVTLTLGTHPATAAGACPWSERGNLGGYCPD